MYLATIMLAISDYYGEIAVVVAFTLFIALAFWVSDRDKKKNSPEKYKLRIGSLKSTQAKLEGYLAQMDKTGHRTVTKHDLTRKQIKAFSAVNVLELQIVQQCQEQGVPYYKYWERDDVKSLYNSSYTSYVLFKEMSTSSDRDRDSSSSSGSSYSGGSHSYGGGSFSGGGGGSSW